MISSREGSPQSPSVIERVPDVRLESWIEPLLDYQTPSLSRDLFTP